MPILCWQRSDCRANPGTVITVKRVLPQYFINIAFHHLLIGQLAEFLANGWAGELRQGFWAEREGFR